MNKLYQVKRIQKEPLAAVIYPPDDGRPAYIPQCPDYTFEMLVRMAGQFCDHPRLKNKDGYQLCPDCSQRILCREIKV
jgi:hypothetical protein